MSDAETGEPLVDKVLDKAGQKGTGKWTAQVALDLGVPIPTIAAAIDARVLSSMKDERVARAPRPEPRAGRRRAVDRGSSSSSDVHDALYAAEDLLATRRASRSSSAGSREWNWNIDLREIARIWKAGCIIRAKFLDSIMRAYERNADLPNLLLDDAFRDDLTRAQDAWRRAVASRRRSGIPVPAFAASLAYFDSYRTADLPQNLTQAQRDSFGAHTYQRNDKGADAPFVHTEWEP